MKLKQLKNINFVILKYKIGVILSFKICFFFVSYLKVCKILPDL